MSREAQIWEHAFRRLLEDTMFEKSERETGHQQIETAEFNAVMEKYVGRERAMFDPSDETIEDGFGSVWSIKCLECERNAMEVVRPGKVQCGYCG